jgi:tRNA nucleotidyltransferase/poly(A) polymerase
VAVRSRARRSVPLSRGAAVRRAFRALSRRSDVALVAAVARPDDGARAVGGAVRDAFLGRRGGDLDLVVPEGRGEEFAGRLAARAGTRVVSLGARPTRVLKIPFRKGEIDIWEETESPEADLLRRDFTVNALSFSLPGGVFTSAPEALADLEARRLAPPRPGVFLEDPLRVMRAGRFLAELPGFHVAPSAIPEMKNAGGFLRMVAGERVLAELDALFSAPPGDAARGLRFLERVGVLHTLIQSSAPRMRRGILLAARLDSSDARVARALLLLPLGRDEALNVLRMWRVSREELRLAGALFALRLSGPRGPRRPPTRRDVAELLRFSSPFEAESIAFLRAAGGRSARSLADASERIRRRPAALRRIRKPVRPLSLEEIRRAVGLTEGPGLGGVLDDFDLALASGEINGVRAARAWLEKRRTLGNPRPGC